MLGRPTEWAGEIQEKVVSALRAGAYPETAAAFAGISVDTFRAWIKRGEHEERKIKAHPEYVRNEDEQPYLDFLVATKDAIAEGEMRDLANIAQHSRKSWQASAWRLERRFQDRYSLKNRHEHSGPEGKPIEHHVGIDLTRLSDEQLKQLEGIVAASTAKPGSDPSGDGSSGDGA